MLFGIFSLLFVGIALRVGATVPIPDNDPFYQPPTGFASSPPGTVFKNRAVASGILGVSATQILYRTTNANGTAAATVATILKGLLSSGDKLVIYNDYEDSSNTTCAPSYLFSIGIPILPFGPIDPYALAGLANGWTLVIADYEGIGSAFGAGRLEGQAVLDALRATINYAPAGISKNARLGGYGYSGGAIATGWAAALHKTYAPELNIVGWAFGGTPANLTSTFQKVEGTIFAGFAPDGIGALSSAYPGFAARVNEIVTPAGAAAIAQTRSQCAALDLVDYLDLNFESTEYNTLGSQLLYDPVIASYLVNLTLGVVADEYPIAPVYMFHGSSDEVIPYESALKTANAWCANGASVEFVTETGGTGHLGTMLVLQQNATDWLNLRMQGTPPASGCSNASYAETGISLKRDGVSRGTVLDRFGQGDQNIISDVKAQRAAGFAAPSFWSYQWRA
ncbi:hypothetical protein HWV62_34143 [Athelia sp. TMB]|nr:hypothetical protein HWV62_13062 [Athelia sp. TMB]KAF7981260.1 hypothetical protein HWV62_34143 [Athelia sp. TMB]